jgi:hypothetical protein
MRSSRGDIIFVRSKLSPYKIAPSELVELAKDWIGFETTVPSKHDVAVNKDGKKSLKTTSIEELVQWSKNWTNLVDVERSAGYFAALLGYLESIFVTDPVSPE